MGNDAAGDGGNGVDDDNDDDYDGDDDDEAAAAADDDDDDAGDDAAGDEEEERALFALALGKGLDGEQDKCQALDHLCHGENGGELSIGNQVVDLGDSEPK